jgi:hypothetical protein
MTQTVICMKWGTLYGPEYVNRLYAMVKRNTARPLRFICFTDDTYGISEPVETHNLPPIQLPQHMAQKPWRKVSLWQKDLLDLSGNVLYFDLDLLVTGNIDDFFQYNPDATFCVIHNWTTRKKSDPKYQRVGNTSCYRFRIGSHVYLYDLIQKYPLYYKRKYRNSQTFISNEISEISYWPYRWCLSFKHSLLPSWPARLFRPAPLPKNVKLVAFTGKPDIHDVALGQWPENNLIKRPFKQLVTPKWVADAWR